MWLKRLAALTAALLFCSHAAALQGQAPGPADDAADAEFRARIDRAWQYVKAADLVRDNLAPPQWFPGGDRFVHWAASGPNAGTWVAVDARTGAQEPLLAAADLKAQLSALTGSQPTLPAGLPFVLQAAQNRILFQAGGRAFALDLGSGKIGAIGEEDVLAKVARSQATPSPDGSKFLLPQPGGFAVADRSGRILVQQKGEQYHGWQAPSNSWSPDGRYLLAVRNDQREVHKLPVVDYRPLEAVTMVPYAKAGTALPSTRYHLVDAAAGSVRPLPPIEGEGYSWVAGWRPDGSEALVLHLSRDGKKLDLIGFNAQTAASRLILREERPDTFIGGLDFASLGWQRQLKPLDDNRRFIWMSERDGWRHAYLYDYSGKLERQVTKGNYVVEQVLGTAPGGKEVFLVASADGPRPYDRSLYRADLRGRGMKRVSTAPGDHQISLSPSGRYYTVAYSTFTEPRRSAVGSTAGGEAILYSQADAGRLAAIGYVPPEPFTALAADGKTPLHGVIFKPSDFDPAKRYPVLNLVYAGPFTTFVPRGFTGSTMSLNTVGAPSAHGMAQLGFVVVMVDGRGTPGRSKAFQDASYGRVGQTEIPDQIAAIRQAAATRPYMDLERVGIIGHSWGGYFATRGILSAPDFYKAAYAGAQGMLEEAALVNEPHLGLPSQNPQGYEAGSNVRIAGNLKGAYKMMHGTSDVNAGLSTTMRMAEALIKAKKPYELLIMPGVGHTPQPPFDRYYFEDQMRFFTRHLGGPR
ncbi:MAG TPA: DPP IV N-terminal domain-containing protein [Allosphingosinicella sp.]|nr:DPP IV N-terminal domain-containing protein [Allosphingosinicella sp.]